eukprot:2043023-Prymnesium_polylepis.1
MGGQFAHQAKHALHFSQVGQLGEGLRQLDHRARIVTVLASQVVVGKAAATSACDKHQTGERRVSTWMQARAHLMLGDAYEYGHRIRMSGIQLLRYAISAAIAKEP